MVKSGFFNAVDGDRTYNADDFSNYQAVNGDGIVANYLNALEVTNYSDTMTAQSLVYVATGKAYIFGKYVANSDNRIILQLNGSGSSARTDLVYVYVDLELRRGNIDFKTGSTSLVNTSTRKEIALASIYRPANDSRILQSNITDLRTEWASFPIVKTDLHQSSNTHTRNFPDDFTYNSNTNTYDFMMSKYYFNPSTDDCIVSLNGCILQRDRSNLTNVLYYTIDPNGNNSNCYIKISVNSNVQYNIAHNPSYQYITVTVIKDVSA